MIIIIKRKRKLSRPLNISLAKCARVCVCVCMCSKRQLKRECERGEWEKEDRLKIKGPQRRAIRQDAKKKRKEKKNIKNKEASCQIYKERRQAKRERE